MAVRANTTLLVAVRPFLRLVGVRLEAHGRRLTGTLHPAEAPVLVDLDTRVVRVGSRQVAGTPREFIVRDGEVHVALGVLARVLEVQLRYDADDAVVRVEHADDLPVARRAIHAAARAAAIAATHATADAAQQPSATAGAERGYGAVLDYSGSRWGGLVPGVHAPGAPKDEMGASVGLALSAPLGVLSAVLNGSTTNGASGENQIAYTWERTHGRGVRTVRIGGSHTAGLRTYGLHGILISNAAPARDQAVAATTIAGAVPSDWTVEAYRSGSFLAVDSSNALVGGASESVVAGDDAANIGMRRYALTVPVHAGQTAVDVMALGPDGQLRTTHRLVQVMPMELASHTFEYRVAAGLCDPFDLPSGVRAGDCHGRMNVDLRYAVSDRWAVRGGADQAWIAGPNGGFRPYAALVATPWDALSLTVEHADRALNHLSARFQPSTAVLVSAERVVTQDTWVPTFAMQSPSTRVSDATSLSSEWTRGSIAQSNLELVVAPHALGRVVLEAHDLRTGWAGGSWEERRLGVVVPTNVAEVRSYVRRELASASGTMTVLGTSATVLPVGPLAHVLGHAWVSTIAEVTPNAAPARAELTVANPLGAFWRVDAGVAWDHRSPGYRGTVSITSQLPIVRTTTQTSFASRGAGPVTTHNASGAVVWDPAAHSVVLVAESGMERGGISGHVFLDLNGNGRRDPGEPGIPHAQLALATRTVTTDEQGRYRLLGLPPQTIVRVAVDSASLSSPWWAPGVPEVHVRPVAGRITSVDFPVVVEGIVNGRVEVEGLAAGTPMPNGARVVLRDLARGHVYSADVFSDGGFSMTGLPAGRFDARVDLSQLDGVWRSNSSEVVVGAATAPREAKSALDVAGAVVDDVRLVVHGTLPRVTTPTPTADDAAARDTTGVDTTGVGTVVLLAPPVKLAPGREADRDASATCTNVRPGAVGASTVHGGGTRAPRIRAKGHHRHRHRTHRRRRRRHGAHPTHSARRRAHGHRGGPRRVATPSAGRAATAVRTATVLNGADRRCAPPASTPDTVRMR